MSTSFWLPPIQKSTESEKKVKTVRIRQDSTSSVSSASSESSSSSSSASSSASSSSTSTSSSTASSSKKLKQPKTDKKTEELQAIYEDFMPAEEEEIQASPEAGPELASEPELLREVLQRLNKDLDTFSKLKTRLKPAPKIDPVPVKSQPPAPSTSQPSKKRKAVSKKELNKLRREREKVKKKVLALTKIGQNYQSKLNTFFAELSKQENQES